MLPPIQQNPRPTYIDPQNQVPSNQRPYAFTLSSNVQDLYSAYRLNSNMGIQSYSPPKPIENRVGFFNERPTLGDSQNNNRIHTVSLPRINPAGNVFDMQTQPPLANPAWQNQYGLPLAQEYDQPPQRRSQRFLSMNGPMVVPTPPVQVVLYSLFPQQFQKKAKNKKRNDTLDFYEKIVLDQNKHLKKIARSIERNQFEAFDIATIKKRARRLKPNKLSDDTPPEDGEDEESEESAVLKQSKGREKSRSPSPKLPDPVESPASPEGSQKVEVSPLGKRLQKMAKGQRPLHLHQILWVLVYPSFLRKDADEKVDGRKKKVEAGSLKKIQEQKSHVVEFIHQNCMASLQDIYKQKKALVIVNEGLPKEKPVSEKDRLKNFGVIMEKLTAVVKSLNSVISLQEFPKGVTTFFEGITKEKAVLPPKFLTEIEISYLEFSQYGTLKNANEMRCKMILGMFVFVRVLICTCLASPWVVLDQVKETAILVKNLKGCSSVLYYIIMDYFREHLEVVNNNQDHIPVEKRVVPTKNSLLVFSTHHSEEKSDEVLTGIYKREALQSYFDSQQQAVNKMKELLVECFDKLFFLVPKGRE